MGGSVASVTSNPRAVMSSSRMPLMLLAGPAASAMHDEAAMTTVNETVQALIDQNICTSVLVQTGEDVIAVTTKESSILATEIATRLAGRVDDMTFASGVFSVKMEHIHHSGEVDGAIWELVRQLASQHDVVRAFLERPNGEAGLLFRHGFKPPIDHMAVYDHLDNLINAVCGHAPRTFRLPYRCG